MKLVLSGLYSNLIWANYFKSLALRRIAQTPICASSYWSFYLRRLAVSCAMTWLHQRVSPRSSRTSPASHSIHSPTPSTPWSPPSRLAGHWRHSLWNRGGQSSSWFSKCSLVFLSLSIVVWYAREAGLCCVLRWDAARFALIFPREIAVTFGPARALSWYPLIARAIIFPLRSSLLFLSLFALVAPRDDWVQCLSHYAVRDG